MLYFLFNKLNKKKQLEKEKFKLADLQYKITFSIALISVLIAIAFRLEGNKYDMNSYWIYNYIENYISFVLFVTILGLIFIIMNMYRLEKTLKKIQEITGWNLKD